MPLKIVRNDITNMHVEVIVNSANWRPEYGRGTDAAVYKAAGEKELLAERKEIGKMAYGECKETKAYDLEKKGVKYIFHVVPPRLEMDDCVSENEKQLHDCYRNALLLAAEKRITSIAFPVLGSGMYDFPKEKALSIALQEITDFLLNNEDICIYLVVYDLSMFRLACRIDENAYSYIDEAYVKLKNWLSYGKWAEKNVGEQLKKHLKSGKRDNHLWYEQEEEKRYMKKGERQPISAIESDSWELLNELVKKDDFYSVFQKFEGDLKGSIVYGRSHISKQLYAKINPSNKNYIPDKKTIILLCMGLNLNIEDTKILLESAGYCLRKNYVWDQIIEYYFRDEDFLELIDYERKYEILNKSINYYLLRSEYEMHFSKIIKKQIEKMDYEHLLDAHINLVDSCVNYKKEKKQVNITVYPFGKLNMDNELKWMQGFMKRAKKLAIGDEILYQPELFMSN